jgi:hypothetical protein
MTVMFFIYYYSISFFQADVFLVHNMTRNNRRRDKNKPRAKDVFFREKDKKLVPSGIIYPMGPMIIMIDALSEEEP